MPGHWHSPIELENVINKDSSIPQRMQNRHLVTRAEGRSRSSRCARDLPRVPRVLTHPRLHGGLPPTVVTTQCDADRRYSSCRTSTTRVLDAELAAAFREASWRSVRRSACCRATTQSRTVHRAEYQPRGGAAVHLLRRPPHPIEDLVCAVVDKIIAKHGDKTRKMDPSFDVPERPFPRMTSADAIKHCNEHGLTNKASRLSLARTSRRSRSETTDMVKRPIFMSPSGGEGVQHEARRGGPDADGERRPADCGRRGDRWRVEDDEHVWPSKSNKLGPTPSFWHTDERKYGTCPHWGSGPGTERISMWLLGDDHTRNVCLSPRHIGRCEPVQSFLRKKSPPNGSRLAPPQMGNPNL